MKKTILLLFLTITSVSYAQNDSLQKERYRVINAMYSQLDIENHGKVVLDKNFFLFLGLGAIISDHELMESLTGSCADLSNEKYNSYSEILSPEEISELREQISWFGEYKKLDHRLLSDKIRLVTDSGNEHWAISLPLVHEDKAVVYLTNKNSQDSLLVLVKENGEWKVRCVKIIYAHFND